MTKVPVFGAIVHGCRAALSHGLVYAAYVGAWTALTVLAGVPVSLLVGDSAELYVALSYLPAVAMLVGYTAIFIAVNRAILRHEPPTWSNALRLGRRELRVFGLILLFLAIGYVELTVLWILLQLMSEFYGTGAEVLFGEGVINGMIGTAVWGFLISVTLTPFFGLALPLAAVDAKPGMFRQALALGRGNRWRLAAIGFVPALPFQIGVYAPSFIWADSTDVLDRTALLGLSAMIYLCGAVVRAAAFAWAFRAIAEGRQESSYGVFD